MYFSDKKQKVGLLTCVTEQEACAAMIREIEKVMQALYGLQFAK